MFRLALRCTLGRFPSTRNCGRCNAFGSVCMFPHLYIELQLVLIIAYILHVYSKISDLTSHMNLTTALQNISKR